MFSIFTGTVIFLSFFVVLKGQLTVEDWFFPVSVAPLDVADNSVYDDEVDVKSEAETINITNKQIKDYYEKDRWDKWNNRKSNVQHRQKDENNIITIENNHIYELDISKSKQFLPGQTNVPPTDVSLAETKITMTIIPIVQRDIHRNQLSNEESNEHHFSESFVTGSQNIIETVPTTTPMTTKMPHVNENTEPIVFTRNADFLKLRKDVNRLSNEMKLVKSLLNKIYKRKFKKRNDVSPKPHRTSTRLSAIQEHRHHDKWISTMNQNRFVG